MTDELRKEFEDYCIKNCKDLFEETDNGCVNCKTKWLEQKITEKEYAISILDLANRKKDKQLKQIKEDVKGRIQYFSVLVQTEKSKVIAMSYNCSLVVLKDLLKSMEV